MGPGHRMSGGLAEATHLHSGELGSRGPPTPTPHPPTGGWAGAGRPDPRGEEVSPGQPELQTQGRGAVARGRGGAGGHPGTGWEAGRWAVRSLLPLASASSPFLTPLPCLPFLPSPAELLRSRGWPPGGSRGADPHSGLRWPQLQPPVLLICSKPTASR